ncbi:MAG: hypothetical protein R2713_23425 [Ilumatobacteraceae bacterium]
MAYDSTGQVDMPPVTDWVNDWDWLDPQWGECDRHLELGPRTVPRRHHRALRAGVLYRSPWQRSPRSPTATNFSSIWVNVSRPTLLAAQRRRSRAIRPTTTATGGCCRRSARKKVAVMEDELRTFCRSLIAGLDGSDTAGSGQFSQHIPVHGICLLTGLPRTPTSSETGSTATSNSRRRQRRPSAGDDGDDRRYIDQLPARPSRPPAGRHAHDDRQRHDRR